MKINAECPSCEESITFHKPPRLGQILRCQFCESELEVIDLDPVTLDWPYEEEDFEFDGEYDYAD